MHRKLCRYEVGTVLADMPPGGSGDGSQCAKGRSGYAGKDVIPAGNQQRRAHASSKTGRSKSVFGLPEGGVCEASTRRFAVGFTHGAHLLDVRDRSLASVTAFRPVCYSACVTHRGIYPALSNTRVGSGCITRGGSGCVWEPCAARARYLREPP